MRDLLNMYSDRNGCYGHGDYGSRLIKKKAPSQTNDAPGFPEPPMQIYDFTYALLLFGRLSSLGLR